MSRDPRRELEREHQPRTMKAAGEYEPRLSRQDEQQLADQAEAKREEWQRAQAAELARRIEHAERAIALVRELLPERRGAARAIDYYMRRVSGLLASLQDKPDS